MRVIDGNQYHELPNGDLVSERHPCPAGYRVHVKLPMRFIPVMGHTERPTSKRRPCRNCRGL